MTINQITSLTDVEFNCVTVIQGVLLPYNSFYQHHISNGWLRRPFAGSGNRSHFLPDVPHCMPECNQCLITTLIICWNKIHKKLLNLIQNQTDTRKYNIFGRCNW